MTIFSPPDSSDLSGRRKARLTSSHGGAKMDPFRAKASATVDRATRGNTLRISTRHSSGYLQASARTEDQRFVSSQRASSSISHCRGMRLCSLLFVFRGQASNTSKMEPGLHVWGEKFDSMGAGRRNILGIKNRLATQTLSSIAINIRYDASHRRRRK